MTMIEAIEADRHHRPFIMDAFLLLHEESFCVALAHHDSIVRVCTITARGVLGWMGGRWWRCSVVVVVGVVVVFCGGDARVT